MNEEVQALVENLGLKPLDGEGGFFRRVHTFYSDSHKESGSTILYLMTWDNFSRLHRLASDEVWFFLDGSAVEQLTLTSDGSYSLSVLGRASEGMSVATTVKAGVWQASRPIEADRWSLCAATMVPAWDEEHFALAREADLVRWEHCPHLARFLGEGR